MEIKTEIPKEKMSEKEKNDLSLADSPKDFKEFVKELILEQQGGII